MRRQSRLTSRIHRVTAVIAMVALALIGVSLSATGASASPTYSISGTVFNSSSVGVGGLALAVDDGSVPIAYLGNSNSDGTYEADGLAPGTYTVSFSDPSHEYSQVSTSVTITASDLTNVNLTILRYGVLSGTVTNGAGLPANSVEVSADHWNGSNWSPEGATSEMQSNGTYSIPSVDVNGEYRIVFTVLDPSQPFFSTYYGGTQDSPDPSSSGNAGIVNGTVSEDQSGLDVALVAAGYITGTVKSGGSPVVGELVDARDSADHEEYDADHLTDASGDYSIKVVADTPYLVESGGDNGFEYQAYNGHNLCDCTYDAVTVGAGLTQSGIDFSLVLAIKITTILGGDDGSGGIFPLEGGTINLYRAVTGGYSLVDAKDTDSSGEADLASTTAGDYRIRVSHTDVPTSITTWYPIEQYLIYNVNDPAPPGPLVDLPTATCYLSLPDLHVGDVLLVEVEITPDYTQCGPEPALSVPTTPSKRQHSSGVAPSDVVTTATPTPTPTPTPTETPSASPSPSASATPHPTPTVSTSGLPWWVWALIIVVVLLILGALGYALFRRR